MKVSPIYLTQIRSFKGTKNTSKPDSKIPQEAQYTEALNDIKNAKDDILTINKKAQKIVDDSLEIRKKSKAVYEKIQTMIFDPTGVKNAPEYTFFTSKENNDGSKEVYQSNSYGTVSQITTFYPDRVIHITKLSDKEGKAEKFVLDLKNNRSYAVIDMENGNNSVFMGEIYKFEGDKLFQYEQNIEKGHGYVHQEKSYRFNDDNIETAYIDCKRTKEYEKYEEIYTFKNGNLNKFDKKLAKSAFRTSQETNYTKTQEDNASYSTKDATIYFANDAAVKYVKYTDKTRENKLFTINF